MAVFGDWGTGHVRRAASFAVDREGRRGDGRDPASRRRVLFGQIRRNSSRASRTLWPKAIRRAESRASTAITRCTRGGQPYMNAIKSSDRSIRRGVLRRVPERSLDHRRSRHRLRRLTIWRTIKPRGSAASSPRRRKQKVVLFSHHQLFSLLTARARSSSTGCGPCSMAEDLRVVLGTRARVRHLRPASAMATARTMHRSRRDAGVPSEADGRRGRRRVSSGDSTARSRTASPCLPRGSSTARIRSSRGRKRSSRRTGT